MGKFRKKPVVIDAVQFNDYVGWFDNQPEWIDDAYNSDVIANVGTSTKDCRLTIKTLEGEMTVSKGDWVIRGVAGEIYPCKPDIFAKTYDPVD